MKSNFINHLNLRTMQTLFLGVLLSATTSLLAQTTVLDETFGSAAVASYTGGTSTTPAAISYTLTANNGAISTGVAGSDGFLNLASAGGTPTTVRPYIVAPFTGVSNSFKRTLSENTDNIVWTVNMKASRLMSSNSNTYNDLSYYLSVVLCSTAADLTTTPTASGYALIIQRQTGSGTQNAVRLVKFNNGLTNGPTSTTPGPSIVTKLLESAAFAGTPPTATAPNNISVKVIYTPSTGSWELFSREDPGTTFVDPTSGVLTSAGTVVDATYTGSPMTHFGFLCSASTSVAAGNQFQIDNFKMVLSPPTIPVELSQFDVKRQQTAALLSWRTESELGNAGFYIEQSANGTDFQTVGQVKGHGTSNTARVYDFTHSTPSIGVNYYRLKQEDFNGKTSYSPIRTVVFGKNSLSLKITLVQETLDVVTSDETATPFSIFNTSGQQVLNVKVQGTQRINVSALPAGLYIISAATGEVGRFVKE